MAEYNIANDPDINHYEKEDIQALTLATIGEALREGADWVDLLVLIFIVGILLAIIYKLYKKFKKAVK